MFISNKSLKIILLDAVQRHRKEVLHVRYDIGLYLSNVAVDAERIIKILSDNVVSGKLFELMTVYENFFLSWSTILKTDSRSAKEIIEGSNEKDCEFRRLYKEQKNKFKDIEELVEKSKFGSNIIRRIRFNAAWLIPVIVMIFMTFLTLWCEYHKFIVHIWRLLHEKV